MAPPKTFLDACVAADATDEVASVRLSDASDSWLTALLASETPDLTEETVSSATLEAPEAREPASEEALSLAATTVSDADDD